MKIKLQNEEVYVKVILAVIIVILVNLIFYFGFFRIDLTANKIYSLSKSSKKLVSQFDDFVHIRAVFSKVLPEQFKFVRLYVEDLLKEYKSHSRGKLKFEFIDPQQPKAKLTEQDVYSMGILPVEFTVVERDKLEVKKGFMGLAMLYRDKKEVIPVIRNIESLEYDITTALKKLTLKQKKVIGIVSNHRCDTLTSEEHTEFKETLEKLYELKTLEISSSTLPQVDALIIISPKENFDNKELFWLDQYILSGKPVAFLLDRYNINLQSFWATKIFSNIFDFVSHYGVDFSEDGLIADAQCQRVSLRTQQGFFVMESIIDYPYMPIITSFNKTHPLVKDIQQAVLPFVSPLSIKSGLQNVKGSVLMETSRYSFLKKDVFSINPLTVDFRAPKDAKKGPFVVGVELRGKFKSYFADEDKFNNLGLVLNERFKETQTESRILVISSGRFAEKEFGLLGNIFDYLAQEQELLTIRSKKIVPIPLKSISPFLKILYRYFVTFVPTLLIIAFGLFRWYYRKTMFAKIKL
ncbi:MAG: GldG family protein [Endomicrobia bacterium]|nr:GldG family protein [Endomicrobiia bacterium]